MSRIDHLQLLLLQEEFELLQAEAEKIYPGEKDDSLRALMSTIERLLSHARNLVELAGPSVTPLPWWQEWQRKQRLKSFD